MSEVIFKAFQSQDYDQVLLSSAKILTQIEETGSEEEIEEAKKQTKMVEAIVEYYKDGAKDPKRAYEVLSEIENGERDNNAYLLEYNLGVFAYFCQKYENAYEHFYKICQNAPH